MVLGIKSVTSKVLKVYKVNKAYKALPVHKSSQTHKIQPLTAVKKAIYSLISLHGMSSLN